MTDQIPVLIGGIDHLQTDFNYSMAEFRSLAQAADFKVIQQVQQGLPQVNNKTYLGSSKVQQIQHLAATPHAIQTVIVNDELTPAQLRNLERSTQLYFLDRTELILQIFQKRAHSQQAQLQVAIAQLQYQLPRIHPSQNPLDQQRGGQGINNRGAGESQLELKQRQLRQRINQLQNKLQHTKQTLTTQSGRRQQHLPQVALVGYTNAGKSTTFNQILIAVPHSKVSPVLVQDQLFATLDTTIRRIDVPQLPTFLLSDTIGFISQLPDTLIAAFRSTLQEAQTADLLIQVIDATRPQKEAMIATTQQILTEIGIVHKPMIYAYNKADQLSATVIPQISGPTIYYSAYQKNLFKLYCI